MIAQIRVVHAVPFNVESDLGSDDIPFFVPELHDDTGHYFERVLRAPSISGDGAVGREVEQRISDLLDGAQVLLTSSCTHALEMAAIALRESPRRRVIVPSYSFTSCAAAFDLHQWEVTFADVRPDYLTLDPSSLRAVLTEDVGAVLYVNYGGFAPDLLEIRELCATQGIALIEDNAHGLGGKVGGSPMGAVGDFGTLSFHGTKNLTCGEGGALVIPKGNRFFDDVCVIREKGTNRRAFIEGRVEKYTWTGPGSSYVLSEIAAALLAGNLDVFRRTQGARRAIYKRYQELGSWGNETGFSLAPPCDQDDSFATHIFWLVAPDESTRQALISHLHQNGIGSASHYQALHESPYARAKHFMHGDCHISSDTSKRLIRLPLYSRLKDHDVDRVLSTVANFK